MIEEANGRCPDPGVFEREELPARRESAIVDVIHATPWGVRKFSIGFGFRHDWSIKEVFCNQEKTGSELDALIADGCIGASHALQRGATVTELAHSYGQLRPEGAPADQFYPPASPIGSIMRAAIIVEAETKRVRLAVKA